MSAALKLSEDPNSTLSISWREPDRSHRMTRLGGTVPTIARAMVLDLTQIAPGPYDLVVSVGKAGSVPITSRRRFTIVG